MIARAAAAAGTAAWLLAAQGCGPDLGPRPEPASRRTEVVEGPQGRVLVDSRTGATIESAAGRATVELEGTTSRVVAGGTVQELRGRDGALPDGFPLPVLPGWSHELASTTAPVEGRADGAPTRFTALLRGPTPVAETIAFYEEALRSRGLQVERTSWGQGDRTTVVLTATGRGEEASVAIGRGDRVIADEFGQPLRTEHVTSVLVGWRAR